jgi:hypothetical protein
MPLRPAPSNHTTLSDSETSPTTTSPYEKSPSHPSQESQVVQRRIYSLFPTSKTTVSFHASSPATIGTPIRIQTIPRAFYDLFLNVITTRVFDGGEFAHHGKLAIGAIERRAVRIRTSEVLLPRLSTDFRISWLMIVGKSCDLSI